MKFFLEASDPVKLVYRNVLQQDSQVLLNPGQTFE